MRRESTPCGILVEIDPDSAEAWQTLDSLSQTLFTQGRWDEAIRCCHILLQQPATAREAERKLGYLYYLKHQPQQALDFWTKYLDANPNSLPVLTMTAWLLATDPDQAVRNGGKVQVLALRGGKNLAVPRSAGLGGLGGRSGRERRSYEGSSAC